MRTIKCQKFNEPKADHGQRESRRLSQHCLGIKIHPNTGLWRWTSSERCRKRGNRDPCKAVFCKHGSFSLFFFFLHEPLVPSDLPFKNLVKTGTHYVLTTWVCPNCLGWSWLTIPVPAYLSLASPCPPTPCSWNCPRISRRPKRIDKAFLQSQIRADDPVEKWGKDLSSNVTKEIIQMANKQIQRCSTS